MKSKYFPECFILEAQLGRKPSFAWRSILSSCPLLQEGLIWRVGSGEKINIWRDRWIPRPNTFKIQMAPNFLTPTAMVSGLIDGETLRWNHDLVNQIFSKEEAQIILSIPLSGTRQDDVLIWRGTAKGVFFVRSAYHMQKEVEERGKAEPSSSSHCSGVWSKIWKLPVPNVEKEFLWRPATRSYRREITCTREKL
jgi:hypothetical protein